MAEARAPEPVFYFVGMLGGDPDLLRRARQLLSRRYGPIDLESDLLNFDLTNYYEIEMGPDLLRSFISFAAPLPPDRLAEVKLETNAIERQIAEESLAVLYPRPVNLDPGYVDLGKVVLGTTKDRAHRVYLSGGIYAEVTLQFQAGTWRPWPWTYPDYHKPEYHAFFTRVRERLREMRARP